jgi:hypothetical protein
MNDDFAETTRYSVHYCREIVLQNVMVVNCALGRQVRFGAVFGLNLHRRERAMRRTPQQSSILLANFRPRSHRPILLNCGRHTHESNSGFSTNRSRSLQRSDRSSLTKVPVRSHAASTRFSRKLLDRRRLVSTSPEHRPYLNGGKPSNERSSSKDAACIGGNHSLHSSHWAGLGPGLA